MKSKISKTQSFEANEVSSKITCYIIAVITKMMPVLIYITNDYINHFLIVIMRYLEESTFYNTV